MIEKDNNFSTNTAAAVIIYEAKSQHTAIPVPVRAAATTANTGQTQVKTWSSGGQGHIGHQTMRST